MEERNSTGMVHRISVIGRKETVLTGVEDVLSFDDQEILLETVEGILLIKGEELHVKRLSVERGEMDVEGKVCGLTYSEKGGLHQKGESVLARLFR